ncbi:MAG TPA: serine hydrolase domain-containing protein [Rhizomicrobium sp.]
MAAPDARRKQVENGILPIMRIAGRDQRWPIAERMAHYDVPGVGVAAMRGGEIDWAQGYGLREKGRPEPVDADTVFMGASTSKPVTGFLVMHMVERGVVELDVEINRYLKRWQLPQNDFTRAAPVTLRNMLNHTAGLTVNGWPVTPRGRPLPTVFDLLEGRRPPVDNPGPNEFVMPPVRVNQKPGRTRRYSGGGFLLAQMAIEDLTGKAFDALADELIFQPLGMTRTTFRSNPLAGRLTGNIASGHGPDSVPLPGGWLVSPEMGAGGLFTTAADYARFHIGFRNAWLGKPGAVLRQDLAQEMATRRGDGEFGVGWRVLGEGATLRVNHGGSNGGYQSETNSYLVSGDGGMVFTNAVPGLFLFCEVLNGIADVYDWPGFMPPPKRVVPIPADQLYKYEGEYRIVSGVELPLMKIWSEDGELKSLIPGMRAGTRTLFLDDTGRFFNQSGPYETQIHYGADGRAAELVAYEGSEEILRAVRAPA